MSFSSILNTFSRLSIHALKSNSRSISTNINPLCFRATDILYGEPLKKKKRLDPAIIRAREERKRRRLEKQVRRLQKHARQLKPIAEMEPSFILLNEIKQRTRQPPKLSEEVLEERALLIKDWARYRRCARLSDMQMIDTVVQSQQRALDELRAESEELYQEAVQVDMSLIPYTTQGPVYTPPIKNYSCPDGDYIDITKRFEGEDQIIKEQNS